MRPYGHLKNKTRMHARELLGLGLMAGTIVLSSGCAQLEQQQALDRISANLQLLQEQLAHTEQQTSSVKELELQSEADLNAQLVGMNNNIANLKAQIAKTCSVRNPPSTTSSDCPTASTPIVKSETDKLILGETERVWLDPPGYEVIARIDSGASSSSLHAADITEFERDGEDWVRFEVDFEDIELVIERRVERYVRVIQQADKQGTRRPVVAMRIQLGDVSDTFDFTLADRSHLEHGMILGRNFLTDMALIDVSQQFIQPSQRPEQGLE